jgi:excisionase family DNA binding protein
MEEQLLTPAEVAARLNISKALAYVLLKREQIPTVRIGSLVRVRSEDLDRYVREKLSGPKQRSNEGTRSG